MSARHALRARAVVAHADAQSLVQQATGPLPDDVGRWLAGLCLLEGVPFTALVPDSRMLPPESIRFFFVDENWLDALVDGALSVVNLGGPEAAHLALRRPGIRAAAAAGAHLRRALRRGVAAAPDDLPIAGACSGFLLRSAAVSDWPGLTLSAADAAGADLRPLRIERVSPTVLIAIFAGVVAAVEIAKPAQALHFGLEDGDTVFLRGIGGAKPAGAELQPETKAQATFRDDKQGRQVVQIGALVTAVEDGLATAYKPDTPPAVDPGAFSIQLVAGAERQAFVPLLISSFVATPASIAPGGTSTLSWQVAGADSCTIDPGALKVDPEHDAKPVSPSATTTYTLTATGGGLTATAQATVTVTGGAS